MIDNTNNLPLISIGVSAYNRKEYLKESLDSLLKQTYTNIEIIVVDDGSSDGTGEMVRRMYPQVKYVYQENAGDAAAKNHAVQLSSGDYVVFNDSDDIFLPDAVERLYRAIPAEEPHAISYGTYQTINADGELLPTRRKVAVHPSGNITGDLLQHILVNSCATLIPRDVYLACGGQNSAITVASDYEMSLKLSLQCNFYAVQEPVFLRRRHGSNLSSATYDKMFATFQVFERFVNENLPLQDKYSEIIRRRRVDFHRKLYREARREKQREKMLLHSREAFKLQKNLKTFWQMLAARCLLF